MKIEVKFSYTKTGPKAFIRPYTDEWEPTTTALRAYRKDMRNIKEATQFPEGVGYYAVMNPWLLESVLKANDIDAMQLVKAAQMENPPLENVRYANENEIVWYEFPTSSTVKRCTNLSRSRSFIREWVNYDCPPLYKYISNKKNVSVNGWGLALPIFCNTLVENDYNGQYIIDDSITAEEIEAILKNVNPKGIIAEAMNYAKEAHAMGTENLATLEKEVQDAINSINVMLTTPENLNAILLEQEKHKDEEDVFDCGWLNWYPEKGTKLHHDFELLRQSGKGSTILSINMPTVSQSVTVQSYGGKLVQKLVKEKLGYDIFYIKHLD